MVISEERISKNKLAAAKPSAKNRPTAVPLARRN
jgi:hypothetical protein